MKKNVFIFFIIVISILAISSWAITFIFIPYKKVWLSDKAIYGKEFCYTFTGSCVDTGGHFTTQKLSRYKLWKYKGLYHYYE